jgi:hypothetical protein
MIRGYGQRRTQSASGCWDFTNLTPFEPALSQAALHSVPRCCSLRFNRRLQSSISSALNLVYPKVIQQVRNRRIWQIFHSVPLRR